MRKSDLYKQVINYFSEAMPVAEFLFDTFNLPTFFFKITFFGRTIPLFSFGFWF